MHKAVVFYFSGTGNTWWAADQLAKQLDQRDINADIVSIESVDAKKADWWIKAADLVFFGWPIYGSDLPEPMKWFIDGLIPLEKTKHIHTFCTQMKFSGDGAWLYHKHFEEKNLTIDSCVHLNMPSNLSVWHGILGPPKSKEKAKETMDACAKQIETYIEKLFMGRARRVGKTSYPLGIMQRAPYRVMMKRYQDALGVDKDRCIRCGKCASWCPAGNIKMAGYPEFLKQCVLCMRCYSYCPATAITYKGKTHDIEKHNLPYRLPEPRFKPELLK